MPPTTSQDPWPLPELQRVRRAIVVVDVVESVRLMQEDESGFIDRWRRFVNEVRTEVLPAHGGRMVKSLGDGMLLEFDAPPEAVQATLEMHRRIENQPVDTQGAVLLRLRAGVHVADVVVDDLDVYGAGVNLAARVTTLAGPGQTVVSVQARDALIDDVQVALVDLGDCFLKHYEHAIRAYRVGPLACAGQAREASAIARDYRPSIAVVPFVVSPAGAYRAAIGTAVADDVIAALSRRPDLRVVSRLSSAAFSNQPATPQQIAQLLGVAYVVCGSVEVHGALARVRFELCEASEGAVLWADAATFQVADLFVAQDRVVPMMVAEIGRAVLGQELSRARALPLPSLDRYTLYLGSIALLHRLSKTDFERARELLEHLCEREPRSAAPRAMLAKWYMLRLVQGWSADPTYDATQVRQQVHQALECDADHSFALSLDAHATAHFDGDLEGARQIAERSIEANPQEPNAWLILAGVHTYLGLGAQAEPFALRARDLSPLDPARFLFDVFIGAARLAAGKYALAAESARESIRRNAMHPAAHRQLVIAEMLAGNGAAAREAAQGLLRLAPTFRVDEYMRRYPGHAMPHAKTFADALRGAGLPA